MALGWLSDKNPNAQNLVPAGNIDLYEDLRELCCRNDPMEQI